MSSKRPGSARDPRPTPFDRAASTALRSAAPLCSRRLPRRHTARRTGPRRRRPAGAVADGPTAWNGGSRGRACSRPSFPASVRNPLPPWPAWLYPAAAVLFARTRPATTLWRRPAAWRSPPRRCPAPPPPAVHPRPIGRPWPGQNRPLRALSRRRCAAAAPAAATHAAVAAACAAAAGAGQKPRQQLPHRSHRPSAASCRCGQTSGSRGRGG
mmetsp:Transcript_0/g.3  ORF Transcript_0/g.3 Transcript_0/m.3 type:complete len:212 (-) Transcript_0:570-1205(-)